MEDKCNGKKKKQSAPENDNKSCLTFPDGAPISLEISAKDPTGIAFSIDCFIFI